jgi:hypothetical protein
VWDFPSVCDTLTLPPYILAVFNVLIIDPTYSSILRHQSTLCHNSYMSCQLVYVINMSLISIFVFCWSSNTFMFKTYSILYHFSLWSSVSCHVRSLDHAWPSASVYQKRNVGTHITLYNFISITSTWRSSMDIVNGFQLNSWTVCSEFEAAAGILPPFVLVMWSARPTERKTCNCRRRDLSCHSLGPSWPHTNIAT